MCINSQTVSMEDHHINEVHSQNQIKSLYDKNSYFLVQGRVLPGQESSLERSNNNLQLSLLSSPF